jgi:hypothetical protein
MEANLSSDFFLNCSFLNESNLEDPNNSTTVDFLSSSLDTSTNYSEGVRLDPTDILEVNLSCLDEDIFDLNALNASYWIDEWKLDPNLDYTPLLQHPSAAMLHAFLNTIKCSQDYHNENTRSNVIASTSRALEDASKNKEFREMMFALFFDINQTCGDGATVDSIDIEIYRTACCDNLDDQALVNLLIGAKRLTLIDQLAKDKFEALDDAIDDKDETESVLYCRLKLSKSLNITLNTKEMLYPLNAYITDADLEEIHDKVLDQTSTLQQQASFLADHELWQKCIEAKNKDDIEHITNFFYTQLEHKQDNCTSSVELIECSEQIKAEREKAIKTLILNQTLKFLESTNQ